MAGGPYILTGHLSQAILENLWFLPVNGTRHLCLLPLPADLCGGINEANGLTGSPTSRTAQEKAGQGGRCYAAPLAWRRLQLSPHPSPHRRARPRRANELLRGCLFSAFQTSSGRWLLSLPHTAGASVATTPWRNRTPPGSVSSHPTTAHPTHRQAEGISKTSGLSATRRKDMPHLSSSPQHILSLAWDLLLLAASWDMVNLHCLPQAG